MITFLLTEFDSKRLAMFLIGLFFFGYSSRLSHNSLFYYLCGISIGVTASLFVIILFIGRLIPKVSELFNVILVIYTDNGFILILEKIYGWFLWSKFYAEFVCYSNIG